MPNKSSKEEVVIKEALSDIDQELENLKLQKKGLETRIKHVNDDVVVLQSEESRLREEISALVGKEGILDRKRNKVKEKLEELNAKISKVSKIKQELTEV
ncbi:hypothetical protein HYU14_03585 [Candidatus Woesearchaeota archaeon]|nr:hypothetical protein [Candidatus Woesearchaeota archaeon]